MVGKEKKPSPRGGGRDKGLNFGKKDLDDGHEAGADIDYDRCRGETGEDGSEAIGARGNVGFLGDAFVGGDPCVFDDLVANGGGAIFVGSFDHCPFHFGHHLFGFGIERSAFESACTTWFQDNLAGLEVKIKQGRIGFAKEFGIGIHGSFQEIECQFESR